MNVIQVKKTIGIKAKSVYKTFTIVKDNRGCYRFMDFMGNALKTKDLILISKIAKREIKLRNKPANIDALIDYFYSEEIQRKL